MQKNRSVIIWGDGAVGKGLAVALSSSFNVLIAGPQGSGRGIMELASSGAFSGKGTIEKVESGDRIHSDYCVVALKAYDLKYAAEYVMDSTDDRCICVTNGMGLEEEWGKSWNDRVEPAVLTAGFHLLDRYSVETTEGDLTVSAEGRAFDLFAESWLRVVPTNEMETVRWAKWLVNSVINPLGALSGLRNNQLIEAGLGTAADRLFTELEVVIPADLRNTSAEKAREMMDFLLDTSSNMCSMLQDVLSGRKTEIEFMTGLCKKKLKDSCPAAAVVSGLVSAGAYQPSE
ncbi:MAG: ketopantoate reductase C-terminal domain-containing protein [Candidatus Fermentibacteria bacterium]